MRSVGISSSVVEPQADLARVRRRLAVRRVVQLQSERRALLQQPAGVRRLELRLRAGNVRRDARCVRIGRAEETRFDSFGAPGGISAFSV